MTTRLDELNISMVNQNHERSIHNLDINGINYEMKNLSYKTWVKGIMSKL